MRLKDWAAIVAVVIVISASRAAMAAPLDVEFSQICMPSKSATDAASKARAAGYKTLPPPLRASISKSLKGFPEDGEMLWRADDGEMSIFISAAVTRRLMTGTALAARGDMCMVASMPAQAALQTKLENILDVGRAQPFGNDSAYIFELTDKGPVRLDGTDKTLLTMKMVQGSARMAAAMERRDFGGLMLIIPSVRTKPSATGLQPPL